MAEGKKGFVLYADLIYTVKKLTDVQRGQLMLTILEYVNDLNPVVNDPIIDIVFEPIKQQLKRDLKKWEGKIKQCSDAGKASAEARRNKRQRKSTNVNERQRKSTDSTVNVNVNDNVNVKDIFNFKNSLIQLGVEDSIVSDWLKVRAKKKAANTETAFNAIRHEIEKASLSANECIKLAVERSWQGFKSDWVGNNSIEKHSELGTNGFENK